MIEIFKNTNYDFLGKKWLAIGVSLLLLAAGGASVAWRALDGNPYTHPFNLGVDFAGGTIVTVKFKNAPDLGRLRSAVEQQGVPGPQIVLQPVSDQIGQAPKNEVLVRLPNLVQVEQQAGQSETAARATSDVDVGKQKVRKALDSFNDPAAAQGKLDLNAVGRDEVKSRLIQANPLSLSAGEADAKYAEIANRIITYRDQERGGLIGSVDEAKNLGGVPPQVGDALAQNFFAGAAAIKGADAVSPQVGADLRNRAVYVTLLACLGMLLYIAFRFKSWGFGIGAVVAVFHDVLITLGVFSITQWEINLTVIAALLTLIGFSMNDTIVIFDRVRELRRLMRRETLEKVTNDAVNQTLSRTVITNGTTFLSVLALVLFGGEVLKSFSWALLIGVIVGTYSTVYIASPFMLWWEGRKKEAAPSAASAPGGAASVADSRPAQVTPAAATSGAVRRKGKKGRTAPASR
jgi:preprotein translocase subunit SecF